MTAASGHFWACEVQVIQDDVDLAAFVDGRDVVHEVEKLATPSAPIVSMMNPVATSSAAKSVVVPCRL